MPPRNRPTAKETEAAVEKSAEFLEKQSEPDPKPVTRPTTPSASAVEAAVERSEKHLAEQNANPPRIAGAAVSARDKTMDAAPVSAGGTNSSLAASPVDASRDKTMDAAPVFSAPITDKPKD